MNPVAFRHQPSLWAALTHLLLFAGVFALFMGRKPGVFRSSAIQELLPGFYSHVLNFSLSYMLLAGVGFIWLLMGVARRHVAWAALALALLNVVYETLLPVLNTRDPIDAVYGVAGTAFALAWLSVLRRFGLQEAPSRPAAP